MRTFDAALRSSDAHHIARRTSLLGNWLAGHSELASRCRSQAPGFGTTCALDNGGRTFNVASSRGRPEQPLVGFTYKRPRTDFRSACCSAKRRMVERSLAMLCSNHRTYPRITKGTP